MFKVKFVVHKKNRTNLEVIKVVGNLPILGNWNPMNGLELQQYEEGQWQSIKYLQIQNGQEFQFKLVKIVNNSSVQWQQLPNNSNRKFKPKYNSRLILTWSNHIGKALNEAKSSLKLKGLPGVMVKGYNQAGMLKKNPLKKKIILSDSDSQEDNPNDSFNVGRKKSSDIRESINSGDIQQIYYDTTELQNAYQNYKKIQINIVSGNKKQDKFLENIQQQLKQLHELQNFKFKWLTLNEQQGLCSKLHKKISFKKIQKNNEQKIYLQQFDTKNFHKNHFIFLDLDAALKTEVGNTSSCIYLPSNQFEKAIQILQQLQKFQFICFDNPEYNKKLLNIFYERKLQNQQEKQSIQLKKKSSSAKSQKQKYSISLQKIIQQLQFCQSQVSVNTVYSFTKTQAISKILVENSILFIDSQIMKTDRPFFQRLMNFQYEKRLVIIIHKIGIPQWMYNYATNKNVCVVLQNFTKLYFLGKLYDPSQKHTAAINYIQMTAKLFEKQNGGNWKIEQNCFTFVFKQGCSQKSKLIKNQLQKFLNKDLNYFKLSFKQNKLKITWNLSHPVRLLRTLLRLKFMQQGKIGDFFIVSQNQNYADLKQQLQLLQSTNYLLLENGKDTKIYDFGFSKDSNAKYNIKRRNQQPSQINQKKQCCVEKNDNKFKKQKKMQFLEKCCEG